MRNLRIGRIILFRFSPCFYGNRSAAAASAKFVSVRIDP
jgi:hypothetical protein